MQTIDKHGAGSHVMRPDRVYATGVLSPMAGFAPGQDVQSVVSEFTRRAANLGAAGQLNFFDRMKLRFAAFMAKKKAQDAAKANTASAKANVQAIQASANAIAHASAQGQAHGQAFGNRGVGVFPHPTSAGMAYAQVGTQVAPHMIGQVQMLARLTQGTMPRAVAEAQVATTLERWHNLRWNG